MLLLIIAGLGISQAESAKDFFNRINNDWAGLVREELPKLGVEGDKQKCVERFASKGIASSPSTLISRMINEIENKEAIEASGEEASLAHMMQYYIGRTTLIAHRQGNNVSFLAVMPAGQTFDWVFCFIERSES